MKELYTWRDKAVELYSTKTKIFEIVGRLLIGLMVFSYINNHLGYMDLLNKGIVVLGLSAVCAVLPLAFLAVIAMAVSLLHMYSVSMVITGCVAVIYLLMFIVYFRFTSELVLVALLTPIALAMNIPYVLPIACGLLVGPTAVIPMSCGVVVYYMVNIVEGMATAGGIGELSMDGVLSDALTFSTEILDCKEMIFFIVVLSVGLWVTTGVRRIHMNYAWKIAMGSGVVAMVIAATISSNILEPEVGFGSLFFGSILAILIGIVVEFLFLSVDYKKTEYLEFEDDEYYYCVKAIPRVKGDAPKGFNRKKQRLADKQKLENQEVEYEEAYEEEMYQEEMYQEETYGEGYEEAYEENELQENPLGDIDLEFEELDQGATQILATEEIERELRNNAHVKAANSKSKKKRHAKTNYKMLKDSVKKELKRK